MRARALAQPLLARQPGLPCLRERGRWGSRIRTGANSPPDFSDGGQLTHVPSLRHSWQALWCTCQALRARGIAGARVGTVDKFQGQQAPVVVYSMASSTAEDAPRGMEFLKI